MQVVRHARAFVRDQGQHVVDCTAARRTRTFTNKTNSLRVLVSLLPIEDVPSPMQVRGSFVKWVLLRFDYFRQLRATCSRQVTTHLGAQRGRTVRGWY